MTIPVWTHVLRHKKGSFICLYGGCDSLNRMEEAEKLKGALAPLIPHGSKLVGEESGMNPRNDGHGCRPTATSTALEVPASKRAWVLWRPVSLRKITAGVLLVGLFHP